MSQNKIDDLYLKYKEVLTGVGVFGLSLAFYIYEMMTEASHTVGPSGGTGNGAPLSMFAIAGMIVGILLTLYSLWALNKKK